MTYRTEFPDFPADAIPQLPEGFEDRSWRNEQCPCFMHDASGVVVWVDHPDFNPWEIEPENFSRYTVQRCTERHPEAGWQFGDGMVDLFATDDAAILARSLPNFLI